MSGNLMHGLTAIGSLVMVFVWAPLVWREAMSKPRSEWMKDQSLMVSAGLFLDTIGVLLITGYRTLQMYLGIGGMFDTITNASLAFLIAGTAILVRSASLNGAHWKWRLYLVSVAAWIGWVLLVEPWVLGY